MEKVTRRELLRLLGLGSAAAVVAACKPQVVIETVEKVVKETVVVEKEVEAQAVSYSGEMRVFVLPGAPVEPVNEFLSAALTARHPNVSVKFEYIVGDFFEQVYTRAAAGTLPDVVWNGDSLVMGLAQNGVTMDLLPWAEADPDVDLDDVFPAMLGLGYFQDKLHFLPSALDVVTMYYNKTLFEEAGAELPSDSWTWDDFITQAKKITALDEDGQGNPMYWAISNGTWNWWATVYPWVVGYGGSAVSEDGTKSTWSTPEALAGMKAYTELWTEHNIAQPVGLDVGGDSFTLGRSAVWTHIQGVRPYLKSAIEDKFDWDIQVLPKMVDGRHRTGMGTWGMSVNAESQMREAAYEFVKGLITPPIQKLLSQKELAVPLLRSVAEDPSWYEGLEPPPANFMAFVNGADDAVLPYRDYPVDCGGFYTGVVMQSYQAAVEAVLRDQQTVEQAFTDCDAAIQACLDEHLG